MNPYSVLSALALTTLSTTGCVAGPIAQTEWELQENAIEEDLYAKKVEITNEALRLYEECILEAISIQERSGQELPVSDELFNAIDTKCTEAAEAHLDSAYELTYEQYVEEKDRVAAEEYQDSVLEEIQRQHAVETIMGLSLGLLQLSQPPATPVYVSPHSTPITCRDLGYGVTRCY